MSMYEFKLPDIGEGIAEGTVGEWHVKEGDHVEADGDLVQIENDKSVEEIPSPVAGTVKKIIVGEGQTAEVGDVLVQIETEGGNDADASDEAASQTSAETSNEAPAPKTSQPTSQPQTKVAVKQDHTVPVLAMPAVRRFAYENDVDLTKVNGTGNHGQVTKADVEAYLATGNHAAQPQATQAQASQPTAAAVEPTAQPLPQMPQEAAAQWPTHTEKMSAVRKATANAMQRSVSQIPHVHVFDEVVVDKLYAHRQQFKQVAADRGVHLTYLAYVVKALAVVLKQFPEFNASVDMANHQIVYKDFVNVGIATDTDHGLFVPVVKNADKLSLFAIAKAIQENAQKARDGKLSGADMGNASMSITNIGSVGGGFFTPIINWPEVAILGMGKIEQEPIVKNVGGQSVIAPARILKLSLAFDHRIIDGAMAQRAVNRLKELLADPELLLMEG